MQQPPLPQESSQAAERWTNTPLRLGQPTRGAPAVHVGGGGGEKKVMPMRSEIK